MKKRLEKRNRFKKKFVNRARMKIIFLLLLICTSFKALSEDKKVTISITDATIEDVLKEIQKQTGIDYLFNHEEIPVEIKVNVEVINGSIEEALKQCLKNTNLTYKIQNRVIIIIPKNETKTEFYSQVIRGKVIDAESQISLPFANIVIITTNPLLGAVTNEEGDFRIEKVPIGRHNIQVSYVGYETLIIPELMVSTGKEMVLTIKLKEQISELKEVQVKAFTKKDKALNSMSTVSARTFSVEEGRRCGEGGRRHARE